MTTIYGTYAADPSGHPRGEDAIREGMPIPVEITARADRDEELPQGVLLTGGVFTLFLTAHNAASLLDQLGRALADLAKTTPR